VSLDATLEAILNAGSGILGVILMDSDGIPIAEVSAPTANAPLPGGELSATAVEFGRVLGEAEKAAEAVAGGRMSEAVISMARFSLVFTRIEEGMTLALAVEPDGNLGKARYLIRRNLHEIRRQIETPGR